MIDIQFHIPELDELRRLARQAPEIVLDEMQTAMERAVLDLEGEIVVRTPEDRATLRNAIGTRVTRDGEAVRGMVDVAPSVAPYAAVMEFGRKPGTWPNRKAIEAWAYRKGFGATTDPKTKRIVSRPGPSLIRYPDARPAPAVARAAFLISRKIYREGIKGKFFFRDGALAAEPKIRTRFQGALRRAVRRMQG